MKQREKIRNQYSSKWTYYKSKHHWVLVEHSFHSSPQKQRQVDLRIQRQPGLLIEFQDSQGYSEKPCLENNNNSKAYNENILISLIFNVDEVQNLNLELRHRRILSVGS